MAKKRLGVRETTELINKLDLEPVLNDKVRQVRWLYNNSNKCTKVYEEKLVRIMIHRLQERIQELELSRGKENTTQSNPNQNTMTHYFITPKDSKTGQKFASIQAKVNESKAQIKKLSEEIGFKEYYNPTYFLAGGIDGLVFPKTPDKKIWKDYGDNSWMPKKNTKKGKEIQAKLDSVVSVTRYELNQCIGYTGYAGFIGFAFNPDAFGFTLNDEWGVSAPKDCEEVTLSKFKEVFLLD